MPPKAKRKVPAASIEVAVEPLGPGIAAASPPSNEGRGRPTLGTLSVPRAVAELAEQWNPSVSVTKRRPPVDRAGGAAFTVSPVAAILGIGSVEGSAGGQSKRRKVKVEQVEVNAGAGTGTAADLLSPSSSSLSTGTSVPAPSPPRATRRKLMLDEDGVVEAIVSVPPPQPPPSEQPTHAMAEPDILRTPVQNKPAARPPPPRPMFGLAARMGGNGLATMGADARPLPPFPVPSRPAPAPVDARDEAGGFGHAGAIASDEVDMNVDADRVAAVRRSGMLFSPRQIAALGVAPSLILNIDHPLFTPRTKKRVQDIHDATRPWMRTPLQSRAGAGAGAIPEHRKTPPAAVPGATSELPGFNQELIINGVGPWPLDLTLRHCLIFRSAVEFGCLSRTLALPGQEAYIAPGGERQSVLKVSSRIAASPWCALPLLGCSSASTSLSSGANLDAAATIALAQCLQYYAYPAAVWPQAVLRSTAAVAERLHLAVSRELETWEREGVAKAVLDIAAEGVRARHIRAEVERRMADRAKGTNNPSSPSSAPLSSSSSSSLYKPGKSKPPPAVQQLKAHVDEIRAAKAEKEAREERLFSLMGAGSDEDVEEELTVVAAKGKGTLVGRGRGRADGAQQQNRSIVATTAQSESGYKAQPPMASGAVPNEVHAVESEYAMVQLPVIPDWMPGAVASTSGTTAITGVAPTRANVTISGMGSGAGNDAASVKPVRPRVVLGFHDKHRGLRINAAGVVDESSRAGVERPKNIIEMLREDKRARKARLKDEAKKMAKEGLLQRKDKDRDRSSTGKGSVAGLDKKRKRESETAGAGVSMKAPLLPLNGERPRKGFPLAPLAPLAGLTGTAAPLAQAEVLDHGLPPAAYARVRKFVAPGSLSSSDSEGIALWVDRVKRFQEALASAYALLVHGSPPPPMQQGLGLGTNAGPTHIPPPLPFFMVRFGADERTGNVMLFGRSPFLLQRPRVSADDPAACDMPVLIIARSTQGLRLRLLAAGVPWDSPLDTSLRQADIGSADANTLSSLLAVQLAASSTEFGSSGVGTSASIGVSSAAIGLLKVQLGIQHGLAAAGMGAIGAPGSKPGKMAQPVDARGDDENGDDDDEDDDDLLSKSGEGKPKADNPVPVSRIRGTPDSMGSLLVITGARPVRRVVELLMESICPGGQSATAGNLAHLSAGLADLGSGDAQFSPYVPRRVRVPLASFALPGAASGGGAGVVPAGSMHDVPQILAPTAVPFRHANLCELECVVRQGAERVEGIQAGARAGSSSSAVMMPRWDLEVRGLILPGLADKIASLLALMQVREWRRGGEEAPPSMPILRVRGEAHRATGAFSSAVLLDEVATLIAASALKRDETLALRYGAQSKLGGDLDDEEKEGSGIGHSVDGPGDGATAHEPAVALAEELMEEALWINTGQMECRVDMRGLFNAGSGFGLRSTGPGVSGPGMQASSRPARCIVPPSSTEDARLLAFLRLLPRARSVEEAEGMAAGVGAGASGSVGCGLSRISFLVEG